MPLVTQAEYARRSGVTRQSINRYVREGIIPGHGPRNLVDPAEADRCWVPRLDAGIPQLRMGDPVSEALFAAAAWRSWATEAAARLAYALRIDEDRLRALLDAELEAQLAILGLDA